MDRSQALKTIAAEVTRGDLVFATSAQVALKVKRALDDPACHMDEAAQLVQSEPLLAARAVALANSIAYNPYGREVDNVRSAVSRLGIGILRSLATALAVRQLAGASDLPEHRAMADQLWQHTAHVAALARVIARRITHQDPDTALFAGIVHEVGGFYLLSRLADYPALLGNEREDDEEDCESQIGCVVLKALAVPESVNTAMEEFWPGYLALPPKTLGDTLLMADSLATVKSPLRQPRIAGPSADIDLAMGEETLTGILEESAEEVQSLIDALQS